MIPEAYLKEWRQLVPWSRDEMVEQDLIISRLLVELFNEPQIYNSLAFRGGTALYKLFIKSPMRYSEDIDLVQTTSEPIGNTLNVIRKIIDPLLGIPKRNFSAGRATLLYKLQFESQITAKLKIEINTREHFSAFGLRSHEFVVQSRWFSGSTKIQSYSLEELMGTKLRALYQRKKGRDLFDLLIALQQPNFSSEKTISAFQAYMEYENKKITRAMFEMNLAEKLAADFFVTDISPLLAPHIQWNIENAAERIKDEFLALLPGEPWEASGIAKEKARK